MLYCDRETVDKIEKMKVCTCLNPLHTAMSIYGCMLGYTLISAGDGRRGSASFIQKIGYIEAMPVVVDPGVLNPYEFIGAVINHAPAQPLHARCPQRIATDTSQKLAIRSGETIKAYRGTWSGQVQPRAHPAGAGRLCPLPEGHRRQRPGLRDLLPIRCWLGCKAIVDSLGGQGRRAGLQLPEESVQPCRCVRRGSVRRRSG
ncbi:MAG: hypothetical protein ACLVJH_14820 [Faecalibacterium prausnitzii]